MKYLEACHIKNRYICAVCWSHLTAFIEGDEYVVRCAAYGAEHSGYVTRAYAERRRAEDLFDALEARQNLKDILGLDGSGSAEDAINELFGGE